MCLKLAISRSSYYRWINNPISNKKIEDIKLKLDIKRIHKDSYETYGQRRIKAKLAKEGQIISCARIGRIMNDNGIYSRHRKKYKQTTNSSHNYPIAPDLIKKRIQIKST
jgi:putative transposase